MTQAILFNNQQRKRFAEGALLHPLFCRPEQCSRNSYVDYNSCLISG
jgi:hypothetical protein